MRAQNISIVLGIGLIAAGVLVAGAPIVSLLQEQQGANQALKEWQSGGSAAVASTAIAAQSGPATCSASNAPVADYALVQFTGSHVAQYNYQGVSGDGNWDLLHQRNMVHWHGSADPGKPGNVIIAFHREPSFHYIDALGPGQEVTVQDRACHAYVYAVEPGYPQLLWPNDVTQLVPTTGYNLTLITCNPWYVDVQRLVWRLDLQSIDGKALAVPVGAR